ncbi:hypothetical protein [Bacillus toyonensis]|uniref:hypothetical protein n=1 Tax=Bacillus toyonensis TaxID=155322 RepID=UPI001C02890F|nr:hypothetical protein [Bacillus toyonensis]UFH97149.1 hypothetical protein HQN46_0022830 [Bacillus toyonensis]
MNRQQLKDMENQIQQMFDSLSDSEFDALLTEAGFEVEEGNGEVIFEGQKSFEIPVNWSFKKTFSSKANKKPLGNFNMKISLNHLGEKNPRLPYGIAS